GLSGCNGAGAGDGAGVRGEHGRAVGRLLEQGRCWIHGAGEVPLPVDREQPLIGGVPWWLRRIPDHGYARRRPARLGREAPLPPSARRGGAIVDGEGYLVPGKWLEPAVASRPRRPRPLAERQDSVRRRNGEARFCRRHVAEADGELSNAWHKLLVLRR